MIIEKEVLLDKLNEGLQRAVKFDAQVLAKHKREQAKWAKGLRTELAHAAALDDEGLCAWSQSVRSYDNKPFEKEPSCPISQAYQFEQAITHVELDKRTSFNLEHNGLAYLLHLVDWNPDTEKRRKVC